MESNRYRLSIDIGTTKVVAMLGRYGEELDMLEILSKGDCHIQDSLVDKDSGDVNEAKTEIAIAEALDNLRDDIQDKSILNGMKACVGISFKGLTTEVVKKQISREKADELITYEEIQKITDELIRKKSINGKRVIQVISQWFIVDGGKRLTDIIGMTGDSLEGNFMLVFCPERYLSKIERCIAKVGIGIEQYVLEGVASAYSVLSDSEKKVDIAIIDIGGGTIDVSMFKEGILCYTKTYGAGGNSISNAMKPIFVDDDERECFKEFNVDIAGKDFFSDKKYKVKGLNDEKILTLNEVNELARNRVEAIFEPIFEDIKNYIEQNQEYNLASFALTGGSSRLKGLPEFFAENFPDVGCRLANPDNYLSQNIKEELENTAKYSTSVGLLIYSIAKEKEKKENAVAVVRDRKMSEVEKKEEIEKKEKDNQEKEQQKDNQQQVNEEKTKKNIFNLEKIGEKIRQFFSNISNDPEK